MDSMKHRRLQELDRSNFQIVDGEPDIRGWDVKNASGQKVGEVEELVLDAQERKVRYMVVDLDNNDLKLDHRKVLIPIGLAELDRKDDDVLIPNVSPQQLGELPEYDRSNLTGDVERRIFSTLERRTPPTAQPQSTTVQQPEAKSQSRKTAQRKEIQNQKTGERKENEEVDPGFYRHEYYSVDNLYKNRLHEAESVKRKNESEYERGLRLWERRSEGGIIRDDRGRETNPAVESEGGYHDLDEGARMQMIRNRRNNYRERRYGDVNPSQGADKNIDKHISNEDLGER
jgi:sporulation protein YlmC with PRC-barrel domain